MKGFAGRALRYGLVGALIFGVIFAYYVHVWGTYYNFNLAIEFCEFRYCDFTLYYYEQAKVILDSHAPIAKYFYSPTFALLIWPFSLMAPASATTAWGYLQGVSLALYVASGIALLRKQPAWSHAVLFALTLTAYPILNNWKWGQANTLFVALSMLSLVLQERASAPLSALPLAIAASSRYFPILYAAGYFGARRWKLWLWLAGWALALLVGLPFVTMGPSATLAFYRAHFEASHLATSTWVISDPTSHYLPTVLARVLPSLNLGTPSMRATLKLCCYALVGCNFWMVLRGARFRPETRLPWTFCFIAGCTPLLVPTAWMHYFAYLPVTQAFLLARLVALPLPLWVRVELGLLAWLPSVVFTSVLFFNAFDVYWSYSHGAYLLFANMLMLALAHGLARADLQPALSPQPADLRAVPSST
jgi:hypothetical protein